MALLPGEFFRKSRNRRLGPCGVNKSAGASADRNNPSETSPSYEQSRLGVPGSGDGVFLFSDFQRVGCTAAADRRIAVNNNASAPRQSFMNPLPAFSPSA